ncbi:Nascent polypeptide associated complex NAC [Candidatus Methanoperedens nitroreducens]|uniref:Nascent polypeptide-associated complex protein n=1 Tax=Candidatus Methanoperedens nitratireducens TaxID=1392998 RepID=A0A062V1Y7_9EURY|nr:nascent polypeptide-associated complex protein [Candidatus Methanoperedens nitroreducens]KCZ70648.1 Nascent polypeptide associated complex NAC [Candidatus Methanoperedens nitroreducens]MDJ1420501.1 nascent polypeptide-associated complex protein [Candidatus Methanoperedens sp.]
MFPGLGRGMNPRKMASMMKQMGIDINEIENVEEVIIRTPEKDIIFKDAEVTIMDARGMKTYQIVGTPQEVAREIKIPEDDIKLVMEQTSSSENDARNALKETKGDIAEAILKLTKTD